MTSLLHLDSSANRSDESVTRQLTRLFAETWQCLYGQAGYRYRDLAVEPAPPIDTAYCALGRRSERYGVVPLAKVDALIDNQAEETTWALTRPLIDELVSSQTVLIGAPMYNYTLPAALKAWIDRVSFPGALVDPSSRTRVLRNTKVVIVTSRGGAYGPGTPREGWDYETPYLREYFTKHGVRDLHVITRRADLGQPGPAPRGPARAGGTVPRRSPRRGRGGSPRRGQGARRAGVGAAARAEVEAAGASG
ncbi:FMN-dependent NADH-azoreductase [Kribbella antiqua]|uniref:FMN dependent NADH:quinone oxidoreductase n=1 Tax=Kribbella antiqua TaxID=2512217 RepID=A0A4R2J562_9ACTN|nr:FMN-dependent NADH-azoreductase [Kribbella antiqua]